MVLNSKKAMSAVFMSLLSVIVVVIVILLVIVIFKKISDNSEEQAYQSRCRASLMSYARSKELPFGDATSDEANIKCPTKYVTVESDTKTKMLSQVSNLLAECWYNFGEGKIRLFSAQDEKFCVVCSVFQFEDKSEKLYGLPAYMATTKSQYMRDKKRVTYSEFISGKQTTADVEDKLKSAGADTSYLDGGKKYAVLFTFYKVSYWSKMWSAVAGAVAATVVVGGTIIGLAIGGVTFGLGTPLTLLIITGSAAAGAAIGASAANEKSGVTTEGADWDANIIMAEYSENGLTKLGCENLPVSQMDERFR